MGKFEKYEKCKYCKRRVRWERTAGTGRAIPLDADPSPELGNVLIDNAGAVVLGKAAAAEKRAEGLTMFVAHFATCPNPPPRKKGARSRAAA